MAPRVGFEPTTLRLTAECSTVELPRSVSWRTTEISLEQKFCNRVKLASMKIQWSRRDFLVTLPAISAGVACSTAQASEVLGFVGTYTRGESKGIYGFRFNSSTGKMTVPELAVEASNPSFLAVHPNRKFLYAVGEGSEGTLNSYTIDATTGKLTLINSVSAHGTSTCHLVVDITGKNLLAVNYGNGTSVVAPIKDDGSLEEATSVIQHEGSSVDERRQKGPHAHSVNLSKNNKWAVVADLGLDEFIVYSFDASEGKIAPHSAAKVKPGSGPRHFSFHPDYKLAYGVNEMGCSVTAFNWSEEDGQLKEIQTITTLPSDFSGTSYCAEILVHPTGKFVYASNRGHDSLAVYSVEGDGTLKSVEFASTQGKTPRNFKIDPSGKWLLAENQDSGTIVVFSIDQQTGKLTSTGDTARVDFPVCIKFV